MNIVRSMTLSMVVTLLVGSVAIAQPPGQGPGRGQMMSPEQRQAQMEKMAADLALSEEQKTAYFKIEEDFSTKMQSLRSESQGDFTAMREGMTTLRQERDEAMKALLSEEQWQKYQTIMASRPGPGARGQAQAQQAQENKGKGKAAKEKSNKKKKGGGGGN